MTETNVSNNNCGIEIVETGKTQSKSDDHSYLQGEGGNYWKLRYDKLQADYDQLHKKNQELEEKLLNVVELFEKKKEELVANVEFEKTTLMADVNKLSTKLVDARIKLHDYEEKEIIHASECDAPCHKSCAKLKKSSSFSLNNGNHQDQHSNGAFDPNLV